MGQNLAPITALSSNRICSSANNVDCLTNGYIYIEGPAYNITYNQFFPYNPISTNFGGRFYHSSPIWDVSLSFYTEIDKTYVVQTRDTLDGPMIVILTNGISWPVGMDWTSISTNIVGHNGYFIFQHYSIHETPFYRVVIN